MEELVLIGSKVLSKSRFLPWFTASLQQALGILCKTAVVFADPLPDQGNEP